MKNNVSSGAYQRNKKRIPKKKRNIRSKNEAYEKVEGSKENED